MQINVKKMLTGALIVVSLIVGTAIPAFAGYRQSSLDRAFNGWSSKSWDDQDANDLTEVQFSGNCLRNFQARIRRDLPTWDTTWGSEWINCYSYTDSVKSDSYPVRDNYHYDVSGMGPGCDNYCTVGVATVKIWW